MLHDFLLKNWPDLLQTEVILVGFLLTYRATRHDIRSGKVNHLFQIIGSHRDVWSKTYDNSELLRIKEPDVDVEKHPITEAERRIVKEGVLHIYAVYVATQNGQFDEGEMGKDISDFLRLPIPSTIWNEVKRYYPKQFISYIDRLVNQGKTQA